MDIKTVEDVFKLQGELNGRLAARLNAVQGIKPADAARARKEHDGELLEALTARIRLAREAQKRAAARFEDEIRGYEASIAELRGESPGKSPGKPAPKPK